MGVHLYNPLVACYSDELGTLHKALRLGSAKRTLGERIRESISSKAGGKSVRRAKVQGTLRSQHKLEAIDADHLPLLGGMHVP